MPIKISNNQIIFNDGTTLSTAPSAQASFPPGTNAVFQQTSAPTGWTKITTYNDYALRITNGLVTTYTGGGFTSIFSNSRTPTGSVSVSIGDHNSSTTGSSGSNISIASTAVTGTASGTTDTNTISISGTSGYPPSTAQVTTPPVTVSFSGTTNLANCGFESHSHSYSYTEYSVFSSDLYYEIGGNYTDIVTGISFNNQNGTTGSSGLGSSHSHTVNVGGDHSHTFNIPDHTHPISVSGGSHSHSFSANFSTDSHTHTVTDNGHSHSIPTLSHTATATFSGNSMAFNVNYVDVILATKS